MSTQTLQWPNRERTNKQTMIYQTTTQKTKTIEQHEPTKT